MKLQQWITPSISAPTMSTLKHICIKGNPQKVEVFFCTFKKLCPSTSIKQFGDLYFMRRYPHWHEPQETVPPVGNKYYYRWKPPNIYSQIESARSHFSLFYLKTKGRRNCKTVKLLRRQNIKKLKKWRVLFSGDEKVKTWV